MTVTLYDGTNLKAQLVGTDPADDLAVVKITPPSKGLTVAQNGLKEGDLVIVSNQYRLQPNARIELNTPPVAANEASGRS